MNVQVEELLTTLRSPRLGLGWIADEIVNTIQLGKPSVKQYVEPGQKRRKRGQFTEPLNEREEMEAAIRILRSYFVNLHDLWNSAQEGAIESLRAGAKKTGRKGEALPQPHPKIVLMDNEQAAPVALFDERIADSIRKLAHLLELAEREEQLDIPD